MTDQVSLVIRPRYVVLLTIISLRAGAVPWIITACKPILIIITVSQCRNCDHCYLALKILSYNVAKTEDAMLQRSLTSGMVGHPGRPICRTYPCLHAHALVPLCCVLQAVFDPRALVILKAKLWMVALQKGLLIHPEVLVFPTPAFAKQP